MIETLSVPGQPSIIIRVKRSARARRMTLRVGRADGQVALTLPQAMSIRDAERFVAEQAGWIARQVAAAPERRRIAVGGTVPLRGRDVPIVVGRGRAARLDGDAVAVPDDERAGPRVKALLRSLARTHLLIAVDRYGDRLGRQPSEVTLRDTRSRWGSCSSRGKLMFSWRLVMAPPDVLDYVAAHEVAHLKHMDHSPRFWAEVEQLMPDYAPRRAWLRRHGATLQAVDFEAVSSPPTV